MSDFIFLHTSLTKIANYNSVRKEIESRFSGLTPIHMNLVNSMITRADPSTGIVEGLSYRDLANLLTVDHAPGRRGAGTPQKQTIRSYLRTIEENYGNDFRVITEGQKLKLQFIQLPKIYAHFIDPKQEYTENSSIEVTPKLIVNQEEKREITTPSESLQNLECPTCDDFESPAKKFLYINKQNKLTGQGSNFFNSPKQPISQDFYPSAETIHIALSKGYSTVEEPAELSAFIRHNQERCTQWVDFNPVYLHWLERGFQYQQQKAINNSSRSQQHEHRFHQEPHRKSFVECAFEQSRDAVSAGGNPYIFEAGFNHAPRPKEPVDGINERIRAIVCEQKRRQAERDLVRSA